jgi:hypothetical protein
METLLMWLGELVTRPRCGGVEVIVMSFRTCNDGIYRSSCRCDWGWRRRSRWRYQRGHWGQRRRRLRCGASGFGNIYSRSGVQLRHRHGGRNRLQSTGLLPSLLCPFAGGGDTTGAVHRAEATRPVCLVMRIPATLARSARTGCAVRAGPRRPRDGRSRTTSRFFLHRRVDRDRCRHTGRQHGSNRDGL